MTEIEGKPETILQNVSFKFGIKWTIKNFESIQCKHLKSPKFGDPAHETQWCIELYPRSSEDFISFYLSCDVTSKSVLAKYTLIILDINGKSYEKRQSSYVFSKASYGWPYFVSRDELLSNRDTLLPNGNLTVQCEMIIEDKLVDEKYPIGQYHSLGRQLRAPPQATSTSHYDLTLVVQANEIQAHRAALMAVSPVFAAMLTHDTKEKQENRVLIEDVKPNVLQLLLDYIYEAELDFDFIQLDTLEDLLLASDKYQVDSLRMSCIRNLAKRLDSSNAVQQLAIADRFNLTQLHEDVIALIKRDSLAVITSPHWIKRERDELLAKALQKMALSQTTTTTTKEE